MRAYPRVIAHRCGGTLAPENSLAGIEIAARLGCRAVEFDAMLTADGVPILMHDETLDRTTQCAGPVAERALAEIRACDVGVPTLAEALAACRYHGLWANIELKPSAGREEETGTIVGRCLAADWDGVGVVSSFSEASALAARRELPTAAFAMLYDALPADGWRATCARLGARAIHLAVDPVEGSTAIRLRDAGFTWACYTVNDRSVADRLFALGCSAVFTDRPDLWLPTPITPPRVRTRS